MQFKKMFRKLLYINEQQDGKGCCGEGLAA